MMQKNYLRLLQEEIKCYYPEYTFVEKLQAVSSKVRKQQESGEFATNFLRHFYDISKLLEERRVLNFIGSKEYLSHKMHRFRQRDELEIKNNLAFNLDSDISLYNKYKEKFNEINALFMFDIPKFDEIYAKIIEHRDTL